MFLKKIGSDEWSMRASMTSAREKVLGSFLQRTAAPPQSYRQHEGVGDYLALPLVPRQVCGYSCDVTQRRGRHRRLALFVDHSSGLLLSICRMLPVSYRQRGLSDSRDCDIDVWRRIVARVLQDRRNSTFPRDVWIFDLSHSDDTDDLAVHCSIRLL